MYNKIYTVCSGSVGKKSSNNQDYSFSGMTSGLSGGGCDPFPCDPVLTIAQGFSNGGNQTENDYKHIIDQQVGMEMSNQQNL